MANITTIIEQFILKALGGSDRLSISRNQLAQHFACSPSQINYVLETRFTAERGYLIQSRRGGNGYIEILKIDVGGEPLLSQLISGGIGDELSYQSAYHIADRLLAEDIIGKSEYDIMTAVISDKTVSSPFPIKNKIRAQIVKSIIETLLKE